MVSNFWGKDFFTRKLEARALKFRPLKDLYRIGCSVKEYAWCKNGGREFPWPSLSSVRLLTTKTEPPFSGRLSSLVGSILSSSKPWADFNSVWIVSIMVSFEKLNKSPPHSCILFPCCYILHFKISLQKYGPHTALNVEFHKTFHFKHFCLEFVELCFAFTC